MSFQLPYLRSAGQDWKMLKDILQQNMAGGTADLPLLLTSSPEHGLNVPKTDLGFVD